MDLTGNQKFGLVAIFLMFMGFLMVLQILREWDTDSGQRPAPIVWSQCNGTRIEGTYQAPNATNYPVRLCITPRLTP